MKARLLFTVAAVIAPLAAGRAEEPQQQVAQNVNASPQAAAPLTGVESITVTAQRRTENLQQVPIAISAFTEGELARRQITRTIDVVSFIPNMEGHNNTGLGTANTYSIRALNNTESIATFDPPVGTYVDDVYIARQNANNFSFFDVDHIEVLRGPQGTLFGRNTTGGSVNVYMKKPAERFGGFGEIAYGKYNQTMGRASVDVPVIADKFLTKLSGFYIKDDGYVRNQVTGQHENGQKTYGIRGAFQARFSDSVRWDFSADYTDEFYSNLVNFVGPNGGRVDYTRLLTGQGLGTGLVSPGLADIGLGDDARSLSVISNVEVQANSDLTINFITGYRRLRQDFMTDSFDSLSLAGASNGAIARVIPGTATPLANDGTHNQFTQEIKAAGKLADGRIEYVAGFYWFSERNTTNFANISLPVTGSPTVNGDRVMRNRTDAGAGYAQVDYHVTDKFKATAGIRYTDETKDIQFQANGSPLPHAPNTVDYSTADIARAGIPTTLESKVWTPRFALNYQATDDFLLFASATRGFKSGGWNARAYLPQLALDFKPEFDWTYEGGLRSEWLDRKLRVNLTGFYMNDRQFQLPAGYADPVTQIVNYITRNFADLHNYGLESEITLVPVEGLDIYWSAGLQHARYANLDPSVQAQQANCQALLAGGRPTANVCNAGIVTPQGGIAIPARAPAFTSTLGANYTFQLPASMELTPNIAWNHVKGHWIGTSQQPGAFSPSRDVFNAGVTLKNVDQRWSLTADCTNCFNKTYPVSFLVWQYLNEPVRWTLHARYDF